ncbi:MAG: HAD hydrolase-like protein [Cyanobacteria bacterium Co-bin8]|nr:HAD hydrolase-like protein [Cyanobacteria bacterium Co-bin8]
MTTFLFDFDGTIADTLGAIVEISNRLAPEFGIEPVTTEEIKRLRDLSAEQLLRQTHVPLLKLVRLLRRVRRDLQAEIPHLSLNPGMAEALLKLKSEGHCLGIVTSNSAENVHLFLEVHSLQPCFQFVETGASVFGKNRVLRQLLRRQRLKPAEVLYVGDETRDVDASHRVGIRVIAVTWGFNSRVALERHRPDFLIDVPQTLIEIASTV